ncbi:tetratricopeptide repeat protein [Paraburkholderia sp. UYCP14C]|uniref:tetratricopeptide repeat protein n=1 Tax=Paraburkholderia sp. UYCP14C TaxID=2511130 RepID=UPI001020CA81|nr:tetratricopeptide repeat protein [Paraburkholderia sp. UYCP14C]RZF27451.1 tetratricopeptide repeat protein [Paraburkholderia sp. UYCP14C]
MDSLDVVLENAKRHHTCGKLDIAERYYQQILSTFPTHFEALWRYGSLKLQQGQSDIAIEALEKAIQCDFNEPSAWSNLAIAYSEVGRDIDAGAAHERACALAPDRAAILNNFGNWLATNGKPEEAITLLKSAIRCNPVESDYYANLALAMSKTGQFLDALRYYTHALALNPKSSRGWFGLGNVNLDLCNMEIARGCFQRALELSPANHQAQLNLGAALANLGRFDEADDQYNAVLSRFPGDVKARYNLAHNRLRRGDFSRGWVEYDDSRYDAMKRGQFQYSGNAKRWRGESIANRRLLLVGEQGFGDQIQFIRYAKLLNDAGAIVDAWCDKPLHNIFERVGGVTRVFSSHPPDGHDFWVPLLSAPRFIDRPENHIPCDIPYIRASSDSIRKWRALFPDAPASRPRIGITWAGNPKFKNDIFRSMHLRTLISLIEAIPATWVAVQKDWREEDALVAADDFRMVDPSQHLHDFNDTAGLVQHLDLIISVDTSVAHLAGAMGKPVWIMVPLNSDWRWQLNRSDSPWYSTARLFRQKTLGQWDDVVIAIANALKEFQGG